jgi:hypothetical protein
MIIGWAHRCTEKHQARTTDFNRRSSFCLASCNSQLLAVGLSFTVIGEAQRPIRIGASAKRTRSPCLMYRRTTV